jgi:hypothetical protein
MELVLQAIHSHCSSTQEAIVMAREITDTLKKYTHTLQQKIDPDTGSGGQDDQDSVDNNNGNGNALKLKNALESLQKIFNAGVEELSGDLGSTLQNVLTNACKRQGERLHVATLGKKHTRPLSPEEMYHARQATTALKLGYRLYCKACVPSGTTAVMPVCWTSVNCTRWQPVTQKYSYDEENELASIPPYTSYWTAQAHAGRTHKLFGKMKLASP